MQGARIAVILVFLLAPLFASQLQLVSPAQNAIISGEGVSLSFVATGDFSSSFSCTIKINGLSFEGIEALNGTETTTELVPLQPETDYLWNATCVGTGETLESETWNFTVHSAAAPPTAANFGVSYGTTNFSAAADLGNVANLTLAALYGKIKFADDYPVNASGQGYDSQVVIGNGFISVNSSGLHPTFNHSATLTLNNASCPAKIYYAPGAPNSRASILAQGNICNSTTSPSCTNITCSEGSLIFTVSHFTGFAYATTANLTIWDETDSGMPYGNQTRYVGQGIIFFANYSNSSSEPITGATCQAWFSDSGWNPMDWNPGGFYAYNRTFGSGGTFDWNASCNSTGHEALEANDTVLVNASVAVQLNGPANGAQLKSSTVLLNWTPFSFQADPTCNVSRNSTVIFSGTCANNQPCAVSNTTQSGAYSWDVTCYYASETATSQARSFTVDSTAPAINLMSPANSTYSGTSVSLTYSVSDQHLDKCRYSLDGGGSVALSNCGNSSLTSLEIGPHSVTLYANDTFGNSDSATEYFSVYRALSINMVSPSNGETIVGSSTSLRWIPYNFTSSPICTVLRNNTEIFSDACPNGQQCSVSSTLYGFFKWNVTCEYNSEIKASATRGFTQEFPIISISLADSELDFGAVNLGQSYDSGNLSIPDYFVIMNDGNVPADIEVNATRMFTSATTCTFMPCINYRAKAGPDATTPYPICSSPNETRAYYFNVPGSVSGLLINDISPTEGDNAARVFVNITVPLDEPGGSKNSVVTFWAKSDGTYACD